MSLPIQVEKPWDVDQYPAGAQARLRTAAEDLAAMAESAQMPGDWQERLARYRDALRDVLATEGLV
jgi:hypothetical protein